MELHSLVVHTRATNPTKPLRNGKNSMKARTLQLLKRGTYETYKSDVTRGCNYSQFVFSSNRQGDSGTTGKTPTCLLYEKLSSNNLKNAKKKKKVQCWGQRAKIEAEYQEKKINKVEDRQILMEDFKLFLSPKHSKEIYRRDKLAFEKKASSYCYTRSDMPNDDKQYVIPAIDVISDYLRELNYELLEELSDLDTEGKKITSKDIKYVLTVPAFWGRAAKNTLIEAANRAEMIKKENINDLLVITEPEAAALYCETAANLRDFFVGEKKFILCDGGGGTVDLVTFNYSASEGNRPSTIKQKGRPDGAMCGSTLLDAKFASYIIKCFEDIRYPSDRYPSIESAMNKFKEEKVSKISSDFTQLNINTSCVGRL